MDYAKFLIFPLILGITFWFDWRLRGVEEQIRQLQSWAEGMNNFTKNAERIEIEHETFRKKIIRIIKDFNVRLGQAELKIEKHGEDSFMNEETSFAKRDKE